MTDTVADTPAAPVVAPAKPTAPEHLAAFLAELKNPRTTPWFTLLEHASEHIVAALGEVHLGNLDNIKAEAHPLIQEAIAAAFAAAGYTGVVAAAMEEVAGTLADKLLDAGLEKLAAAQNKTP